MSGWLPRVCLALVLVTAACAEPPNKEMDQAQGAIDAARAAGADRYAAAEFKAANDALGRARQAVTDRDYRLALNNALESREHAQNAARDAADAKAQLRGEVERSMAEVAALIAQANAQLQTAQKDRSARRTLRESQQSLSAINAAVQKAGEAMRRDDYIAAKAALTGVKERAQQVSAALPGATATQSSRRRR